MSNKTLIYISAFMVASMFILLFVDVWPMVSVIESEHYLTYDGVKGSSITHQGKLYTLNFKQQSDFITLINKGKKIGRELIKNDPSLFSYSKIEVYQFEKPTITITPIAEIEDNIVFSAPQWNENGYIQDTSNGKLAHLLDQTYDH